MKHLTPMQKMYRHFTEKTYKRAYAIFRRAYRLGGLDAVYAVRKAMNNEKHAYTAIGKSRISKAFASFLIEFKGN